MTTIGRFEFPTRGTSEHETWEPAVLHRALDRCVLAVARTRIEGAWAAYVSSVAGQNHRAEIADVLDRGARLDESIARAIFPVFENIPYAR